MMSDTSPKKKRSQSSKDTISMESLPLPTKLSDTQKRKKRRKVAKQKKKDTPEEVKSQPTCLRLVMTAGKFCNFVGSALVAPFKPFWRFYSLEKQISVLQAQVRQLQRQNRQEKRFKKPEGGPMQVIVVDAPAPPPMDETIPVPPPMDDAPPAPPMDSPDCDGPPLPPPLTPEGPKAHKSKKSSPKSRQTEPKKEEKASGVTLADITNIKLRKPSAPQGKAGAVSSGVITKEDILKIRLRKGSDASQDGKSSSSSSGSGGLNLAEIKGFKLKRTQNKSPGGTPRKSRRQVTSPDEATRAAAYAVCAGVEGTATANHAFAALRKKFLASPRGAAALQKTQENGNENIFSQLRTI